MDNNYSKPDQTPLRNKVRKKALSLKPKIQELFPELEFRLYWTKKNTFGYVFADFEKYYRGLIIGKGENALYNILKNKYACIVLSNKIPDKYSEEYDISDGKVFRLNIIRFRDILSKFGKTSDTVTLFLEEALPSTEELEALEERIKQGKVLEKKLTLEKVARFIDTFPEQEWKDVPKLIDAVLRIPQKLRISSQQIVKLLSKSETIPAEEEVRLSTTEFSRILDIISKSKPIEFDDQDAPKMIDLLNRFSTIYHIKDRKDLEKLIDIMINFLVANNISKPTDFNRFFEAITKISTHYQIEKPEDFEAIMELCKISDDVIKSNYNYFKERLAEFKSLIDNDATLEREIQKFITEHRWLLDFKFWSYDIIEKEKEIVNIGFIDLYLSKKQFKITNVAVVEFKKPDLTVTDERYRTNKPVLTKGTVSALNQTMHYIENLTQNPYTIVEGWVIAGRKSKESDYFVEVFNKYVHGITTLTYQDLYNKAKDIVDAFTSTGSL